jgi:hypothetical protein
MRFEDRDYYRVQSAKSRAVCFYDTVTKEGVSWAGPSSEARTLQVPPSVAAPWDAAMSKNFPTTGGDLRVTQSQAAS